METVHEPLDPARTTSAPETSEPPADPAQQSSWLTATRVVDIVVIVAVTGFVLGQLGLGNLLLNTTPAGGDMGAHVWGPAFLRDHLLPHGRLSGWTPDWYDGFPAFEFYMVLPALLVIALNEGAHGRAALVPAVFAAFLGYRAWRAGAGSPRRRHLLAAAAVVAAVLLIGMPYDVAFKLVTVLGVLSLPVAAYALGRLADLPFPTPALFSIATLPFIFNREPTLSGTGNIIGGNLTSTLAGEYSFSLSLTFGVLFLGTVIAGFRTGRYRWLAAVLLALTALCHVIVAIFVLIAAALAFLVWPGRARLVWLACALPVGGLLTAFWTLPFFAQRAYVNDMGWEKLPSGAGRESALHLLGQFITNAGSYGTTADGYRTAVLKTYLAPSPLTWLLALAMVGLVVAILLRIRTGIWLALVAFSMAVGFIVAPETRLWNARLLPFYYLTLVLLAALGIGEMARALVVLLAADPERPTRRLDFQVKTAVTVVVLGVVVVLVGLPLKALPGETSNGTNLKWLGVFQTTDRNLGPLWAQWNYSGYEKKPAYPEFYGFMNTMADVGKTDGCGRLMWEYDDPTLERYGTPMAPMLVSMFTDSCIGSEEGLYFESSTTTPFHFIDQRELSYNCSCAQRNLPYGSLDMTQGVQHLQMLGVKYYAASTAPAKQAADANPDLVPIAESAPWKIYEVKNSDLVQPLANQPAVLTNHNDGLDWVYGTSDPHTAPVDANGATVKANGPAMTWYTDPSKWNVYLAADGPADWARVADGQTPAAKPEPQANVSNVHEGTDTIDFDVDRTGTPILVKTSYFPDWKVDGAQGPYRVTPNLMVVIPTSSHVHLHYGHASVDFIADGLTLLGIALVIVLARARPLRMPEPPPSSDEAINRFVAGPRLRDRYAEEGEGLLVEAPPSATLFDDREPPDL